MKISLFLILQTWITRKGTMNIFHPQKLSQEYELLNYSVICEFQSIS